MNELIGQYIRRLELRYPNRLDFLRARTLVALCGGILVMVLPLFVVLLASGALDMPNPMPVFTTSLVVVVLVCFTLYLTHTGHMLLARLLAVMVAYGLTILLLAANGASGLAAVPAMLGILLANVFFGRTGGLIGALASLVLVALFALAEVNGILAFEPATPRPLLVRGITTSIIGTLSIAAILWLFTGNLQETLIAAERRARQLRAVAEIGQVANASMQSENLLPKLVDMIRDRLVFYHVQIFMIDEKGEYANLVASTGYAGEQLLARGHRLAVNSRSVIGQVTQHGQLVYATDTSTDPIHQANEFLSATRSELALPLMEGNQIIGALDVQSTRANAFSNEDIETLQVMATQIGVALSNARLFSQIETSMQQNRVLYEQAQENLSEVERLNRQLTGQAWQEYLFGARREFGVLVEDANLQRSADWTPTLTQAVKEGRTIIEESDGQPIIAVPLDVRGQILGALEVTLPPGVSELDAQELIEAVAARLALALDNSRLFEEAQTLAQQEHVINELGGRLQSAGDVDEMLRTTLTELSRVLGANSASVRLQATPLTTPSGNGQD